MYAYDCVFLGGKGHQEIDDYFGYVDFGGAEGIESWRASDFLFLSGCTLRGGDGAGCDQGREGLRSAGVVKVLDSTITGGGSCPPAAPISATGPIEFLSGESLSMIVNNPTRSGEPTLFTFEGPPGAPVYVLFSLTAGARYRPTLHGADLLGAQRLLSFFGHLAPNGRLQVVRSLGTIPPAQLLRLFAQSLCLLPFAPVTLPFAPGTPHLGLRPQLGTGAMVVRLGQSF